MQRKTSYKDVPAGTQNRFKVLFFSCNIVQFKRQNKIMTLTTILKRPEGKKNKQHFSPICEKESCPAGTMMGLL